jgi:uncharacterized UPF0160 family protein
MNKILNFFKKRAVLVTHSQNFHLDDVFACAALSLLLKKRGRKFKIVRTRDLKIIEEYKDVIKNKKNDIFIFDIGGEYDEENNLFDHHQREGAGVRKNGVSYSSFGLV